MTQVTKPESNSIRTNNITGTQANNPQNELQGSNGPNTTDLTTTIALISLAGVVLLGTIVGFIMWQRKKKLNQRKESAAALFQKNDGARPRVLQNRVTFSAFDF